MIKKNKKTNIKLNKYLLLGVFILFFLGNFIFHKTAQAEMTEIGPCVNGSETYPYTPNSNNPNPDDFPKPATPNATCASRTSKTECIEDLYYGSGTSANSCEWGINGIVNKACVPDKLPQITDDPTYCKDNLGRPIGDIVDSIDSDNCPMRTCKLFISKIQDITVSNPSKVETTSATLNGSFIPDGPVNVYFRYSTAKNRPPLFCNDIYGSDMQATKEIKITNNNPLKVTTEITSLLPDTRYYYCMVVSSSDKISYSRNVISFKTQMELSKFSDRNLSIATYNAYVVSPTSAYLNGYYNSTPAVAARPATDTTPAVEATPTNLITYFLLQKGNDPWKLEKFNLTSHLSGIGGNMNFLLTGLTSATTYHYRAVIERGGAKVLGTIFSFDTDSISTVTPGTTPPPSVIDGHTCPNPYDKTCPPIYDPYPPIINPPSGPNTAELSDLFVNIASPTSAIVNAPTTLSAYVKNQSAHSTSKDFFNFFQVATKNPDTVTNTPIKDLPYVIMPTLDANNYDTTTQTYTFSSVGTYYIRACADKENSADAVGVVSESYENNNCGAWRAVSVSTINGDSEQKMPDLIPSISYPSIAVVDTKTQLSSTIKNQGDVSTGIDFNNFFQVSAVPSTSNNAKFINLPPVTMSALGVNTFGVIAQDYTFATTGTYYVRACVDKKDPTDIGLIQESDESNNCGEWGTVEVGTSSEITPIISPTPVNPDPDTLTLGQNATPPTDAVVRYHEGIETVFARQIMVNTELAKSYGYKDGNNLQNFAWNLADKLAKTFGYVGSNGQEIRVSSPDIAAYQLYVNNGILTVYEYYNSKIVNIQKMTDVLRSKYDYEYYFKK